ncbi:MAG TPA: CDP-alcohol phosphatidyltransferase family protein, partial [Polyangiaceae bacterium]|nr:CDP-alcohol phosphatidyltransferase family protein [Polyangiaceae bacterium]
GLAQASGPVVLAWGEWVAEHLALEAFVEQAGTVAAGTMRTLTVEGADAPFPAVVLGDELRERAATLPPESFADAPTFILALKRAANPEVEPKTVFEGYFAKITDAETAKSASFRLLERLRWRPGGLVAKYLNRPISIRLSYLLLDTKVTPNQTTIFAFLVGAVGVVFVFLGGYQNTIIGTALMQANSVIDGIDGELARIRHQNSEYGAYLDSVCDEILNAALMIAVGYNLSTYVHHNPLYMILGTFAGLVSFFYASVHWHCKAKHGLGFYWWFEAYKPRREVQRSTSTWSYLKKLTMKESYLLLFLLAAIFGGLEALLWIFAAVGVQVLVLFTIHIPIKRARW